MLEGTICAHKTWMIAGWPDCMQTSVLLACCRIELHVPKGLRRWQWCQSSLSLDLIKKCLIEAAMRFAPSQAAIFGFGVLVAIFHSRGLSESFAALRST